MQNLNYQELVQQIRRQWLTHRVPVGLLLRDVERQRQAERVLGEDPYTLMLPLTTDPQSVFRQVQRLQMLVGEPWPISNVQRDQHSQFALSWLAQILADPYVYGFYDLHQYRDELSAWWLFLVLLKRRRKSY